MPAHYCVNPMNIWAFVLGCDPTGFDKQGNRKEFEIVFGIGRDDRYFAGIRSNLGKLGISMDQIYVQNLITQYQEEESSKNQNWLSIAQAFIRDRCDEFDQVDPSRTLPVFLTSQLLYKALLKNRETWYPAQDLYKVKDIVPVSAIINKLGRPLIPLYRHPAYALKNHPDYVQRVIEWLQRIKDS